MLAPGCLDKRLQDRMGRREECGASMRCRKIKKTIVGARRVADIHPLQHLFDHPEISGIADKISSEFTMSWPPEWHVVAQNIVLISIGIDNGGERLV